MFKIKKNVQLLKKKNENKKRKKVKTRKNHKNRQETTITMDTGLDGS
jgi:hypothetical protein